jgi:hypothetical protein
MQEQLMDELLDKDAKSELESELCINWSEEVKPPYKLKMFCGSGMFISEKIVAKLSDNMIWIRDPRS